MAPFLTAQIKIGDRPTIIFPYALLELESSHKGFILPRLTTANRDSAFDHHTPVGTLIFNPDSQQIECFSWSKTSDEKSKRPIWIALDNGLVSTQKPEKPKEGQRYYDRETEIFYFYTNAQWIPIGGPRQQEIGVLLLEIQQKHIAMPKQFWEVTILL